MCRRSAFESTEGFDPEIKVGEDWDLCYRIARKHKVGFVSEPLVNYRLHPGGAHKNIDHMEKGMGRFYEKAFATEDADVLSLKSHAYGNFHRVLSGSYFRIGDYSKFAKHAILSIRNRPANLGYFLRFPFRRLGISG